MRLCTDHAHTDKPPHVLAARLSPGIGSPPHAGSRDGHGQTACGAAPTAGHSTAARGVFPGLSARDEPDGSRLPVRQDDCLPELLPEAPARQRPTRGRSRNGAGERPVFRRGAPVCPPQWCRRTRPRTVDRALVVFAWGGGAVRRVRVHREPHGGHRCCGAHPGGWDRDTPPDALSRLGRTGQGRKDNPRPERDLTP
jgi:hypothetical protein